jgi:hypothetical protein
MPNGVFLVRKDGKAEVSPARIWRSPPSPSHRS